MGGRAKYGSQSLGELLSRLTGVLKGGTGRRTAAGHLATPVRMPHAALNLSTNRAQKRLPGQEVPVVGCIMEVLVVTL